MLKNRCYSVFEWYLRSELIYQIPDYLFPETMNESSLPGTGSEFYYVNRRFVYANPLKQ
jgi:hypothetical protein